MIYTLYELHHALLTPARLGAEIIKTTHQHPLNPLAYTHAGRTIAANAEMFERLTRRFGKPEFMIPETTINGEAVAVAEETVIEKPFCNLIHFDRQIDRNDPKVLVVAPLSGHFATLLRGTVEALLPHHDIYITDWIDAKMVPQEDGDFSLDSYITYLREFLSLLGPDTHIIGVCQPAVPVFAAVSLMATENDPNQPLTMTLMGGPIDTRVSKTQVTELTEKRDLQWFIDNVIYSVPTLYPGAGRPVYPGFIQLGGFMSMNLDRHIHSHYKFYQHLIEGDGDSAKAHRKFYNEYLSVMDIDSDFYLQTVETVFQKHDLPKGKMVWNDPYSKDPMPVRPQDIKKTALLTVEGEKDDISALGQTTAAHDLARKLPPDMQYHHFQMDVGHYGIFNGRRWREQIMPRLRSFMRQFDPDKDPVPKQDLKKVPDLKPEKWDKSRHGVKAVKAFLRKKAADEKTE